MKIYLLTDLEGVAGVNRWIQTREGASPEKLRAMHLLTQETNAAIEGILEVEPECEIVVFDGHGYGGLIYEALHPHAKVLLRGNFSARNFGMDASFDALMFVGQHAMEGTPNAPLAHTFSSLSVESYKLNGELIGEFGYYAALFGTWDIPTIFLAGDDKACAEAQGLIPDMVTVATKQGMGIELALHLSASRSCAAIRHGAANAVRKRNEIAPYRVSPKSEGQSGYELEIRVREGVSLTSWLSRFEAVDERTLVRRSNSLESLLV